MKNHTFNSSAGKSLAPFIVIEGIDGTGKTTQLKLLKGWIEKNYCYSVHTTREPTDGPIGKLLKEALKGRVKLDSICHALLFAADRIDHLDLVIESNLRRGILVLCDRYYLSSFAYQWRDMPDDLEWIESINMWARHPDLTILIDVPPEVCMERINQSRGQTELFEDIETLRVVRDNYLKLVDRRQSRESVEIIDGNRSASVIHGDVCKLVRDAMQDFVTVGTNDTIHT